MSARKFHLVVDGSPESDREVSGVHTNAALVTTAKIPKVQLDRLRKIRDEHEAARTEEKWTDEAPTVLAAAPLIPPGVPSPLGDDDANAKDGDVVGDEDVESVRSVEHPAATEPEELEQLEEVDELETETPIARSSLLPSEPPAAPELTFVMRYSNVPPVPIVVSAAPVPIVTTPPFLPIVGAPMASPAALAAARVASETARERENARTRTKWLVVAIWATAFALAGGLGWIIAHDQAPTTAPVVTE